MAVHVWFVALAAYWFVIVHTERDRCGP